VKNVVFVGGFGSLLPVLYMCLQSLGCMANVPSVLSIRSYDYPERFSDPIWESCSGLIVPNYTMASHLGFLQVAAILYAPFVNVSLAQMVKVGAPLRASEASAKKS
jgi:hypothetical protein